MDTVLPTSSTSLNMKAGGLEVHYYPKIKEQNFSVMLRWRTEIQCHPKTQNQKFNVIFGKTVNSRSA